MLLLAHRDDAVSPERLIDGLWGEEPPATAPRRRCRSTCRSCGARSGRSSRSSHARRATPSRWSRASSTSSASRRSSSAPAARRGAGDLEAAARDLREALALFRGPPLADAPLLGPAAAEADRLAGLRLAALEERLDIDLALGAHAAAVAELEALAAEHPYRERLHAQLMLALYRAGRQADALDAFRRRADALVEDLGLDPGRELHAAGGGDPRAGPGARPRRAAAAGPRRRRRPRCPAPATPLLGREDDVATAAALLGDARRPPAHAHRARAGSARRGSRSSWPTGWRAASRTARASSRSRARRRSPGTCRRRSRTRSARRPRPTLADAAAPARELLLVLDNFEQLLAAAARARAAARAPLRLEAARHQPRRAAPGRRARAARSRRSRPAPARRPVRRAAPAGARARGSRCGDGEGERIARICERARRPAAGDRARRRALQAARPRRRCSTRLERRLDLLSAGPRDAPGAPADAAGDDRLELRPARPGRAGAVRAARRVRRRLDARGRRGGVRRRDALDGLATLVDQSLVAPCAATRRFAMLETVREYALERLDRARRARRVRARARAGVRGLRRGGRTAACTRATSASGSTASTPTTRTSAPRSTSPRRTATRRPRCGCAPACGATGSRAATSPRAAR